MEDNKVYCKHARWKINSKGEVECENCGLLYKDAIQVIEIHKN